MNRLLRRVNALRLSFAVLSVATIAGVGPSIAQGAQPWWRVQARAAPTTLQPGSQGLLGITATNMGDAPTSGPITITEKLPKALRKVIYLHGNNSLEANQSAAEGSPGVMTCSPKAPAETETVSCSYAEPLQPYESLEISIKVGAVEPSKEEEERGTLTNNVTVSGGGAAAASDPSPFRTGGAGTAFGIERFQLTPEAEGGQPVTQAGVHPFQLTTTLNFNQTLHAAPGELRHVLPSLPSLPRDIQVKLPPGLVGNASKGVIPRCPDLLFSTITASGTANFCPNNTAVGVAQVTFVEPFFAGYETLAVPVFNLEPAPGEPARFGFSFVKVPVIFDTSVRTGEDYAALVSVRNASQTALVLGSQVTFWGNPGEAAHDNARGWECLTGNRVGKTGIPCPTEQEQAPLLPKQAFLSLPTSCPTPGSDALNAQALVDSWTEPGSRRPDGSAQGSDARWKQASWELQDEQKGPGLTNCGALPFGPELKELAPTTSAGNTPAGLNVELHVPQASTLAESGLAESAVRATTVTLPQGMLLSPSAANGLEACGPGEPGIGFLGRSAEFEPGAPTPTFTSLAPACPNASKIGTVRIKSPDLDNELVGGVYLATQNANPFGSLFAMYIVAEDPLSHVLAKLAGEVNVNPDTGQITSTFKNTPDVPFETLKLQLFGGPRASVTTPPLCGTYTIGTSFVPWSGAAAYTPSPAFAVNAGAEGTGCANPRPFAPSFDAHSTNTQAGAFTNFEVTIGRPDSQQALTNLTMRLPTGLAAVLKSVTLCPEPQASQGTCGPGSLIGHVVASTGLGSDPFTVEGGQVFITGPYNGAPFGLSVVVPAQAGPFDFGNVVTRSTLNVDPYTAAATIGSPVPTMVNTVAGRSHGPYRTGAPAQVKQLHVVVDRPNFQFNPTNCNPLRVESTLTGDQGGTSTAPVPFHLANCGALAFKPTLTASTEAHTSKEGGASLTVKVTSGGLGVEGIAKTRVELPLALPSRLTTIQKACLVKVFEANPESGCPEGSNIGTAIIHTPVFANPLKGRAFLVSHGNEAFPDVEFVLKGEGVTIILDGKTEIKKGITKSSFETLPDAPFTEFETILPEGPHSALAANRDLCSAPLIMPTTITSQDGRVIQQNTVVGVKGCPPVKGSKHVSKLAAALAKCRKQYKHNRHKRVACERRARLKYGPKKAPHKHHH